MAKVRNFVQFDVFRLFRQEISFLYMFFLLGPEKQKRKKRNERNTTKLQFLMQFMP